MRSARKAFGLLLMLVCVSSFTPKSDAEAGTLCDSLNAGRFDIVYVCPDSLKDLVRRLAIHRSNSNFGGYSSIVAPIESVTTCFGSGRSGIRDLMARSLAGWSTPPSHLVLVGAYGNNTRASDPDTATASLPTWHIDDPTIAFWWGENDPATCCEYRTVPTDDPYVFAPGSSSSVPMLSVGRLPFLNRLDLNAYIDKVISYELQGPAWWKNNALHLVEDHDYDGNFGAMTRAHAESLTIRFAGREASFARSTLWSTELPGSAQRINNYPVVQPWNSGLGFVLAVGTSGFWRNWGFFGNSLCASAYGCSGTTCDSIQVNYRTPVVLTTTCGGGFNGQTSVARCGTFPVHLLATPGKGAVAVIGPTRTMRETAGYVVAREWFLAAFAIGGPANIEPGRALRQAKAAALLSHPQYRNEILSFSVLGDPALQMPVGNPVVSVEDPATTPRVVFAIRPSSSPTNELAFTLRSPETGLARVDLFDVQGRRVESAEVRVNSGEAVPIRFMRPQLQSGVYFVLASSGSLVATAKIVYLR